MAETCDDLIGIPEAAGILGYERSYLVRLIKAGKLVPYMKMPGRTGSYIFRRDYIESIAEAGS